MFTGLIVGIFLGGAISYLLFDIFHSKGNVEKLPYHNPVHPIR